MGYMQISPSAETPRSVSKERQQPGPEGGTLRLTKLSVARQDVPATCTLTVVHEVKSCSGGAQMSDLGSVQWVL